MRVGSHGFECDLSCGEHWDDPDVARSADDRIGTTSFAFTEATNWGIGGDYTVFSQPDLTTLRSRDGTVADYRMRITITENGQ